MKIIITNILLVSSVFMISGCSESIDSESNKTQRISYQDVPTYQQWQNIEALNCFMMILESIINGCGSGGDIRLSDPYGWQESQMYGRYACHEPWMR